MRFGGQALAYLRPYWAPGLLVLLTQTPSVAFVTMQPLLLRGLIDDAVPVRNGTATVRTRTPCLMPRRVPQPAAPSPSCASASRRWPRGAARRKPTLRWWPVAVRSDWPRRGRPRR